MKGDVDARLQEAVAENEEVLERNQELNNRLRDLQRQQRLDRLSLEQQEAATYELAGKVRWLERENARVQGSIPPPQRQSVGHSCRRFSSPALSNVANSPEVQPEASNEVFDAEATVTGLLGELSLLKQEHDDTLATCYTSDLELKAAERSRQELSTLCHELQLLLEAERQSSARGWQEVERLQLTVDSQHAKLRSILFSARNSEALANHPHLMRQLVRASVRHSEHDAGSDGSRSDEVGISPSPQRWQRAQFWSPVVPSHHPQRQPSSDLQAAGFDEHRLDDIHARTKLGTPSPEAKMGSNACPLHECMNCQQQLDSAKDELHAAQNIISQLERQAEQSCWERLLEQAVCCRRPTRHVSKTEGAKSPDKRHASLRKLPDW